MNEPKTALERLEAGESDRRAEIGKVRAMKTLAAAAGLVATSKPEHETVLGRLALRALIDKTARPEPTAWDLKVMSAACDKRERRKARNLAGLPRCVYCGVIMRPVMMYVCPVAGTCVFGTSVVSEADE